MDHPPTYEAYATPFPIKVHLKQATSLAKAHDTLTASPLWARLLGIAVSREWLHSSGILSTYTVSLTSETTFDDFDKQIRNRLSEGGHGPPIKWLSWVYVLRGRWLGTGKVLQTTVLDQASWESGKVAMQALLDVRIDLVFDFLLEEREKKKRDMLPPAYSKEIELQNGAAKPDQPNGSVIGNIEWTQGETLDGTAEEKNRSRRPNPFSCLW